MLSGGRKPEFVIFAVGLDVAANRALREAAAGLDLVVFSFVLVENAKALQVSSRRITESRFYLIRRPN